MATTNATAPQGATAPKSAPKASQSKGFTGIKSGFAVILCCFVIAICIFLFVFGAVSHFQGGVETGKIWTMLLSVLAFAIERFFAIRNAYGRTSLAKFVAEIKVALQQKDLTKAQALCDKQRGSVANVVGATLAKYKEMDANTELDKDQKVLSIQKALDEATALEMPMLQENLPIVGSIVTLGTLTGLLGTVVGMIRSFSAMGGGEGGADSSALATGISEALVNTASGIATGALSVITYNYYTNKIDRLTFALDEVGFSIVQTFNATH